jgi:hypothetical protein
MESEGPDVQEDNLSLPVVAAILENWVGPVSVGGKVF